jgi:hypothetical protein
VVASAALGQGDSPERVLTVLAGEQRPSDVVDMSVVPPSRVPLVPGSSRLLFDDGRVAGWTLLDDDEHICFLIRLTVSDGEWAMALTCAPPDVVQVAGLSHNLRIGGAVMDATLLPDWVPVEGVQSQFVSDSVIALTRNFVVFSPGERPGRLSISSAEGRTFELGSEALPGRDNGV